MLDQIRESEKIIAFRNVIVHGYSIISDQMVWDIISTKLDNLIEDCKKNYWLLILPHNGHYLTRNYRDLSENKNPG